LDWLQSYLQDREQYVKVMEYRSTSYKVTSGLPQGSHLGPLLFILYFDDVVNAFKKVKCSLFADDLKMFHEIKSLSDALEFQSDIDAFAAWCRRNYMEINVGKCKIMSFYRLKDPTMFTYSIDGTDLTRVVEMSDLGVLMDPQLNFKAHINNKTAKAYSLLGFMKRICAELDNLKTLTSIYNAHVRSHLEYASSVWSPSSVELSDDIESVQKRFVLYALRRTVRRNANYELPPYGDRCKVLGLERLSDRRKNSRMFFMYDVLKGRINAPCLSALFDSYRNVPNHSFDLRRVNMFRTPFHRTNYGYYEPVTVICREFEKVIDIFENSDTRENFRFRIKSTSR
jgi:Reverse transcriptase (RNA-dependent DNA polymerase)